MKSPKLLMTLLLTLAFFLTNTSFLFSEQRPNILFIISDDLTTSALGCYGNAQCQTPNIDKLAANGLRFDRAYCQYPVCGPSRAAFMSGMYCQEIGVMGNGASEHFTKHMGDRPTMTQHFINHGYEATRISKIYHMRVPGDITAGVDGPDHAASWSQTFNCPGPEQWTKGEHAHHSKEKLKPDPQRNIHYGLGYGTAFYVVKASDDAARQPDALAADKAIELMTRRDTAIKNGEKVKPFFMAVGLVRPHVPLVAPAAYYKPYPFNKMKTADVPTGDLDDIPSSGRGANKGIHTEAQKQKCLAGYYASVTFMDDQVGRMLNALKKLNLEKNTIVVFCSDHGWHLGEHNFWQKMSLHEESARIVMMMKGPGIKAGVTKSLVEQIDFYPTLAEMAGLPLPEHLSGISLKPILQDPKHIVREAAYCVKGSKKAHHLIRTDRWAYMVYSKTQSELYDMQKDPLQHTNLAKHPEYASTKKKLQKMLADKLASMKVK